MLTETDIPALILDCALAELAEAERTRLHPSIPCYVTVPEVRFQVLLKLHSNTVSTEEVAEVLGANFRSRYDGRFGVQYFIK